ncbi:MAG: LysR family transcriptional regulator [Alphaproteobacteria bacterium]|nr:LysR family transcriptional regulator [Alphaproteobacteria bacterium]
MHPFDPSQKDFHQSPLDDPRILSGPFWGELRVFLAVAKAKSFNRAAEELSMSQPTVSRQVRRLQDVIGSQLVIPTQSGIKLTPRGQELAESLLALDEKLFEISHDLQAESLEAGGMVRVSVTDGLAGMFVAPELVAFSERYPKIQVHLRNPTNLTGFRENQTDIMVGFAPSSQSDVESRRVGHMHFIPVATRAYIDRRGRPTRENLESHAFVDSAYYSAQTGIWRDWHAATARGTVVHRCDNSFGYALMVRSGLGIGLVANYVLSDRLSMPLDLGIHIRLPLHLLVESERLASRPVRIVYDWLAEVFGSENPWFAKDLRLEALPRDALASRTAALLGEDHEPSL